MAKGARQKDPKEAKHKNSEGQQDPVHSASAQGKVIWGKPQSRGTTSAVGYMSVAFLFVATACYVIQLSGVVKDDAAAHLVIVAILSLILSLFLGGTYASILTTRWLKQARRFSDVDEELPRPTAPFNLDKRRLLRIRNKLTNAEYEELLEAVTRYQHETALDVAESFSRYFILVIDTLQGKAKMADKKASILLDRGVGYSMFGVCFYLVSIAIWQFVAYFTTFKDEYIWGIVSCSFLFAFIEFLAAWFLRQYRHFVDTSTYLMQVKAIFDRYMLAHLASDGCRHAGDDTIPQALLDLLSADIKWPSMASHKHGDISFAKEAIETISLLAKNVNGTKGK